MITNSERLDLILGRLQAALDDLTGILDEIATNTQSLPEENLKCSQM